MNAIPDFDLYRELEVLPEASVETITAAWKSLLKKHHPDVAADPAAALAKTKRLNTAHDWLSDPARRATYDLDRRVRQAKHAAPATPARPAAPSRPAPAREARPSAEPPGGQSHEWTTPRPTTNPSPTAAAPHSRGVKPSDWLAGVTLAVVVTLFVAANVAPETSGRRATIAPSASNAAVAFVPTATRTPSPAPTRTARPKTPVPKPIATPMLPPAAPRDRDLPKECRGGGEFAWWKDANLTATGPRQRVFIVPCDVGSKLVIYSREKDGWRVVYMADADSPLASFEADIDHDGKLELVIAESGPSGSFAWLRVLEANSANMLFTSRTTFDDGYDGFTDATFSWVDSAGVTGVRVREAGSSDSTICSYVGRWLCRGPGT